MGYKEKLICTAVVVLLLNDNKGMRIKDVVEYTKKTYPNINRNDKLYDVMKNSNIFRFDEGILRFKLIDKYTDIPYLDIMGIINEMVRSSIEVHLKKKLLEIGNNFKNNTISKIIDTSKPRTPTLGRFTTPKLEPKKEIYLKPRVLLDEVKISDITHIYPIKVCNIVLDEKIDRKKRSWSIDWVVNNNLYKDSTGRIYFIVVNGIIYKIGGSGDKSGILSTLDAYRIANDNSKKNHGASRYVIHVNILDELLAGNKVEVWMHQSTKYIHYNVPCLFENEDIISSPWDELESKSIKQYYTKTGKYPKWNYQESGRKGSKYPEKLKSTYEYDTAKRTLKQMEQGLWYLVDDDAIEKYLSS